ncbi:MAG TPA: alpha/beta hydrolase [Azospirillaceae bacterium]|nr:alpha/beta hydrolase [Azospirillaceae bacterium]
MLRHITLGEDVFPYTDEGTGPPLLLLHGALGDHRTWQRHSAILSARHRCLAPTQRWFGTTPWREDGPPFGVATHAEDLIAFVRALGIGPVRLVAWSYAGHAAFHAALREPDLFTRVIVYEPGVPTYVTDPDELAAFGQDAQAMFGPIFEAAGRGDRIEAVRRLIDGSGGPGYFDDQPSMSRDIILDNAHSMPRLLAQEPPPQIGADDLGTLAAPVSIVWGSRTRPVFAIPSRAAARCIRSARHVEVPGVGHLWPDEDPSGFAEMIGSFDR